MNDPTLREIVFPRCLPVLLVFICVHPCSSVVNSLLAQSGSRPSLGPQTAAVLQLRRALERSYPNPAARDRAVKQCLSALRSLADLQGAATLVEWRESASDEETAAVDHANRAAAIELFTRAVRRILRKGEPAGVAGTMEMLERMAGLAHATGEPLTLVRGFAPELANLVIQGPPRLRGLAAHTLAQIGPPVVVAVPALSELLQAGEGELRRAAADSFALLMQNALQATGESGLVLRPASRGDLVRVASRVVPAVQAGLDDVLPEVRRHCLRTIGLACAALTRLMEEPPRSERLSPPRSLQAEYQQLWPLLQALRDQGPVLERLLQDRDLETRILTYKALEELGVARARWLRRCAARREDADEKLLAELLHQALPGVAEALTHPDVRVRRSALDVLETSGPLALPALPALSRALRDPDRFVRWSAARTVGKLGPAAAPRTLANLTPLLHDPDVELRKAAAKALIRLNAVPTKTEERSHQSHEKHE